MKYCCASHFCRTQPVELLSHGAKACICSRGNLSVWHSGPAQQGPALCQIKSGTFFKFRKHIISVVVIIYCFSLLLHSLVCVHHIIGERDCSQRLPLCNFSKPMHYLFRAKNFFTPTWSRIIFGGTVLRTGGFPVQTPVWTKHCRCSGRRGGSVNTFRGLPMYSWAMSKGLNAHLCPHMNYRLILKVHPAFSLQLE